MTQIPGGLPRKEPAELSTHIHNPRASKAVDSEEAVLSLGRDRYIVLRDHQNGERPVIVIGRLVGEVGDASNGGSELIVSGDALCSSSYVDRQISRPEQEAVSVSIRETLPEWRGTICYPVPGRSGNYMEGPQGG